MQAFLDGAPVQVTRAVAGADLLPVFYLKWTSNCSPSPTRGASELHLTADGHESNKVQIWIEP